jgi:hypothetical protein
VNPVRQGIYTKLAATNAVTSKLATTTSIFHARAPENAAYPFILFNKQAGTKRRAMGANAFEYEVWLVKAVDRNTTSNLAESIADAVDAALDLGTITVSGKTVADLHHVSDVDYLEADGDQQFRHHGSTFRVVLI